MDIMFLMFNLFKKKTKRIYFDHASATRVRSSAVKKYLESFKIGFANPSSIHLEGEGKGVAYVDETVLTEAPRTLKSLFKQRAKSWNCSVHETLLLCIKIILSKKTHFLLKLERSYELFVFMSDPLRIIYFGTAFIYPLNFLLLYILYLFIELLGWLKTGRKDPFYIVVLSPIYSVFIKTPARFIASFWWFVIKSDYLKKRLHHYITDRKLMYEYALTTFVVLVLWGTAFFQAKDDIGRQITNVYAFSRTAIAQFSTSESCEVVNDC